MHKILLQEYSNVKGMIKDTVLAKVTSENESVFIAVDILNKE